MAKDKKETAPEAATAATTTIRWDHGDMTTSYANVVNVSSTREEVTLLFGTNLLVSMPDTDVDASEHFMEINTRAFLMLGLFFLWIVGLDIVSDNLSMQTITAALGAILFFMLMVWPSVRISTASLRVT